MSCRLCLKETKIGQNIIESNFKCAEWTLVEALSCIFGVEVKVDDPYSKYICEKCASAIRIIGKYRQIYKWNQLILQKKSNQKAEESPKEAPKGENHSKCTDPLQRAIQSDIGPKAKKRRLQYIDRYYSTPTRAIRELVTEKISKTDPVKRNKEPEEGSALFHVNGEVEVEVCKYCSKICKSKHNLDAHCNSQHPSLPIENNERKVGKRRKRRKRFKMKKTQRKGNEIEKSETNLRNVLYTGKVYKSKQRKVLLFDAKNFPNLNFIKKLDASAEKNSDLEKDHKSEHGNSPANVDNLGEDKFETVTGLSRHKGNTVQILNKRYKWLNLKDLLIPLTRCAERTNIKIERSDVELMDQEANVADESEASENTEIEYWKDNLSVTLQTLLQIKKRVTMHQWAAKPEMAKENQETVPESDGENVAEDEESYSTGGISSEELTEEITKTKLQGDDGKQEEDRWTTNPEVMKENPETVPGRNGENVAEDEESSTGGISSEELADTAFEAPQCEENEEINLAKSELQRDDERREEIVPQGKADDTADKMGEMQKMREHLKSTLDRIKKIKEKIAMNRRENMDRNDNTITEVQNTTNLEPHENANPGDASKTCAVPDESEEEGEDNWEEISDLFDENASDLDTENSNDVSVLPSNENGSQESEIDREKCVELAENHGSDANIEVIPAYNPELIQKEQQDSNLWWKNISTSLMKLRQLDNLEINQITKSLQSQQIKCRRALLKDVGEAISRESNFENGSDKTDTENLDNTVQYPDEGTENDNDSDVTNETTVDFESKELENSENKIEMGDEENALEAVNSQYRLFQLKDLRIFLERCEVPREIRQSNCNSTTDIMKKWKETIFVTLPRLREIRENEIVRQKVETANVELMKTIRCEARAVLEIQKNDDTSSNVTDNLDLKDIIPEFDRVIKNEGNDILNENDNINDTSETSENTPSDHIDSENIVGASENSRSTRHNNVQLKECYISLERCEIPSNFYRDMDVEPVEENTGKGVPIVDKKVQFKNWRGNVSSALRRLQSIKDNALDVDKLKISDVKPITKGFKKVVKLNCDDSTDDMYELIVDPKSFEFTAQVLDISDVVMSKFSVETPEDTEANIADDSTPTCRALEAPDSKINSAETGKQEEQTKAKSVITIIQDIRINPPLPGVTLEDMKVHPSILPMDDSKEDSIIGDFEISEEIMQDIMDIVQLTDISSPEREENNTVSSSDESDHENDELFVDKTNQETNQVHQNQQMDVSKEASVSIQQPSANHQTQDIGDREISPLNLEDNQEMPDVHEFDNTKSTGPVVPKTGPLVDANLETQIEKEGQPIKDILEQACMSIQQTEDTTQDMRKNPQKQANEAVHVHKNNDSTNEHPAVAVLQKANQETNEDANLELEFENHNQPMKEFLEVASTSKDTHNLQIVEMNTPVAENIIQDRQISELDAENCSPRSNTVLELESTSVQQTAEYNETNLKTSSILTVSLERVVENKVQPEIVSEQASKRETATASPKTKHPVQLKPGDPEKSVDRTVKKKTKKKKSKSRTNSPKNISTPDKTYCPKHDCNLKHLNQSDERVPSINVIDGNLAQKVEKQDNKSHCSKSDVKSCKLRKKANITVMNETERLARDVEQLSKFLSLLRLIEDNQKTVHHNTKLPKLACGDPVDEISLSQPDSLDVTKSEIKKPVLKDSSQSCSSTENEPNSVTRGESGHIELGKKNIFSFGNTPKKLNRLPHQDSRSEDSELPEGRTRNICADATNTESPNTQKRQDTKAAPEDGAATNKLQDIKNWKTHLSSTLLKIQSIRKKKIVCQENSNINLKTAERPKFLDKED